LLAECSDAVEKKLDAAAAAAAGGVEKVGTDEASFRWGMNEDAMATEKLVGGGGWFSSMWNLNWAGGGDSVLRGRRAQVGGADLKNDPVTVC
jgi:hypothetical protein